MKQITNTTVSRKSKLTSYSEVSTGKKKKLRGRLLESGFYRKKKEEDALVFLRVSEVKKHITSKRGKKKKKVYSVAGSALNLLCLDKCLSELTSNTQD